jgi:DNA-binding response OmpR family regulator
MRCGFGAEIPLSHFLTILQARRYSRKSAKHYGRDSLIMPPSLILVVDHEEILVDTLVLILNSSQQEFLGVGSTNVVEALDIVRGIHPDLVLLDGTMPGTHSLDHAEEMREKWGCKILFMSGGAGVSRFLKEANQKNSEPLEIVTKPLYAAELFEKIREMLRRPPVAAPQKPLNVDVQ